MRKRLGLALLALAFASPPVWSAGVLAIRARLVTDYSALKERPLFAPNRQAPMTFAAPEPEPVAAPPPPPLPPPPAAAPDWQLVGLVRSENLNSATFTSPGLAAAFSLRAGESRDGWTLTEVGRFEVTLDGAGGRASLGFPENPSDEPLPPPMPSNVVPGVTAAPITAPAMPSLATEPPQRIILDGAPGE